jgi:hypothetical protein
LVMSSPLHRSGGGKCGSGGRGGGSGDCDGGSGMAWPIMLATSCMLAFN